MKVWKEQLDPDLHLDIAAERFAIDRGSLRKIGGFENVVYAGKRGENEVILRISHTDHRSIEVAEAELHWVEDLSRRGASVCRPIASVFGKYLEAIESGEGQWLLSMWEKAPGKHVDGNDPTWGPGLFQHWGEVTGILHSFAKDYRLPAGMTPRPDMTGMNILPHEIGRPSPVKELLLEKYQEVSRKTSSLPRTRYNFGLSHRDLHPGNFFVDEGHITVFDFDDCGYDYFVHDIAMATYYASVFAIRGVPTSDPGDVSTRANRFIREFIKGYRRHQDIGAQELSTLPLFAERRRIELTVLLLDIWGDDHAHPRRRIWLERNIKDIEDNVPCLALDVRDL